MSRVAGGGWRETGGAALGESGGVAVGGLGRSKVPKQWVKTLKRDLAVAGIPQVDNRGRTLDVRALRYSFGWLPTGFETGSRKPEVSEVGLTRVELATSASRTQRSTKLSYSPKMVWWLS